MFAAAIPAYYGNITQPELLKCWPTRSPEVEAMVPHAVMLRGWVRLWRG